MQMTPTPPIADQPPAKQAAHLNMSAPARSIPVESRASGWPSALLSAFIDVIEPAVAFLSRRNRWIALEGDDGEIALYRVKARAVLFFAHAGTMDEKQSRILASAKSDDWELRLPADKVTSSIIKIPPGGLEFAGKIVESRLDRLTPWNPDKIIYGFAIAPRPGPDGQIDVQFRATARDIASASLRRLDALGLVPARLGSAAEPIEKRLEVDLFGGRNDISGRARRKKIVSIAVAVPVILLLFCLWSAYQAFQSNGRLAELETRLVQTRQKLVQGSGAMSDRQRDLARINTKSLSTARFALVDRLASILPDHTFLDELDIQQDSIRLAGTSTEASALIKILEAEATLSDARFSAPVTRQTDGRDRFDIMVAVDAPKQEAVP